MQKWTPTFIRLIILILVTDLKKLQQLGERECKIMAQINVIINVVCAKGVDYWADRLTLPGTLRNMTKKYEIMLCYVSIYLCPCMCNVCDFVWMWQREPQVITF